MVLQQDSENNMDGGNENILRKNGNNNQKKMAENSTRYNENLTLSGQMDWKASGKPSG